MRHVHMTPEDALAFGVRGRSVVRVRIPASERSSGGGDFTFGDVLVRVDPEAALTLNIDTDEAGAAGVRSGARAYIDGIQSEG